MMGVVFDAPYWLLLWPLGLMVTMLWRFLGGPGEPSPLATGQHRPRAYLHTMAALLQQGTLHRVRLPRWKYLLLGCALSAMILALAAPVRIGAQLPEPPRQRDILFIVDVSVGMLLRDYELEGERIARIELLKQVLDQLVQALPDDRIGVVVFGESAHTLVPLSSDHRLVRDMLARLQTDIVGRSSALGDALAMAVHEAGRRPGEEQPILVLFSDAQLTTGSIAPLAAAELAAEARLPVHTVAIGAAAQETGEQASSGLIYHPADLALMAQLAERTGASSHHAISSAALKEAVTAITLKQGQLREIEARYQRLPLYHWPLGAALLMLLLVQFNPRRREAV